MTEIQGGVRWEAGGDQHRSCLASPIMGGGGANMFGLEVIPKEIFLWGWVGVKVCSTTIASKSWFCSVNMSKCTFSGPN